MGIDKFSDWLLPNDESSAAQVRGYRLRIALIACSAFLGLYTFVMPMLLPGFPYFIKAVNAQEVDQKIARAVEPLTEQLAKVTQLATDGAAETLVQSIFTATQQKCSAQADGSSAIFWTTRLIDLRKKYLELTGEQFPELHCHDL